NRERIRIIDDRVSYTSETGVVGCATAIGNRYECGSGWRASANGGRCHYRVSARHQMQLVRAVVGCCGGESRRWAAGNLDDHSAYRLSRITVGDLTAQSSLGRSCASGKDELSDSGAPVKAGIASGIVLVGVPECAVVRRIDGHRRI